MIEEKISARGSTSVWIVHPDGRRATVQVPKGADDPANLAATLDVALDGPVKSGRRH